MRSLRIGGLICFTRAAKPRVKSTRAAKRFLSNQLPPVHQACRPKTRAKQTTAPARRLVRAGEDTFNRGLAIVYSHIACPFMGTKHLLKNLRVERFFRHKIKRYGQLRF